MVKTRRRERSSPASSAKTDLERLLEAERRVEADLARARAEAERRVKEAQEAVRRLTRERAEVDAETEKALLDRLDLEEAQRHAEIEADARRRIEAYDAITGEHLAGFVDHALSRVFRG